MSEIKVGCSTVDGGWLAAVTVTDHGSSREFEVAVSEAELARFDPASTDPCPLVRRSFEFLLAREAKESILLYERGPAVKLGTSHLISTQVGLTDPGIVDGIEQRSSLYGLLVEGQGCMGGCSGGPIRYGVVKRPAG